jgi:hypothetical protein
MKRTVLLSLFACALLSLGGTPRLAAQADERDAAGFDSHWVKADEYLVLDAKYVAGSSWNSAYLAKMITPPSQATRNEAEFFIIGGGKKGQKLWTANYHWTRVARRQDLKEGKILFALDGNKNDQDLYVPGASRDRMLSQNFFVGTVNDTSELYKNYIQLSGYKVHHQALRVADAYRPAQGERAENEGEQAAAPERPRPPVRPPQARPAKPRKEEGMMVDLRN